MRVVIIAFLFIFSWAAHAEDLDGNCANLVKSLYSCNKYACKSSAGIGFYIFGYKDSGECNYVEISDAKEFMSCEILREDIHVVSEYVSKILDGGSMEHEEVLLSDIVSVFTKSCNFFKKDNATDQGSIEGHIANELEYPEINSYRDIGNVIKDVRSILFTNTEIVFLGSVFKDAGKSDLFYQASADKSTTSISNQIRLDSILYISPYIWKIWVNGVLFQGDGNLKVVRIAKEYVTFAYVAQGVDVKLLEKASDDRIRIDGNQNVQFTLEVSQTFYPDTLTIK